MVLVIRPVDGTWVMGDDWKIEVPEITTIIGLKKFIELHKNISAYRQQVRIVPSMKIVPTNKEVWSIRRLGFNNGAVLQVEPSNPGRGWVWNPKEYYQEKLLREVCEAIEQAGGRRSIADLTKELFVPPPIGSSLQVFLRTFPDRVFIRTDITSRTMWAHVANPRAFQLPTFETMPIAIGEIIPDQFYDLKKKFPWHKYKEVDDTKLVVSGIRIPDISFEFSLVGANNLCLSDPFKPSIIYAIVYFNGEEKLRTSFRKNTTFPRWNGDARYRVAIPPSVELNTCTLLVEFYDLAVVDDIFQNPKQKGKFLGCLDLFGQGMPELFSNRGCQVKELKLTKRRAGAKNVIKISSGQLDDPSIVSGDDDESAAVGAAASVASGKDDASSIIDQADELRAQHLQEEMENDEDVVVTGTALVKAGPGSFEIGIEDCRNLVRCPDEKSAPVAVVVWNRAEVYISSVADVVNPVWHNENTQVILPGTKRLEECELEVQLWGALPIPPKPKGKGKGSEAAEAAQDDEDQGGKKGKKGKMAKLGEYDRGDFMGAVVLKDNELKSFLRNKDGDSADDDIMGPWPQFIWASSIKNRPLIKSQNIPPVEKMKPVKGSISIRGGFPGLYRFPGRRYQVTVECAFKIPKCMAVGCMVYWNKRRLGISPRAVVKTLTHESTNPDGSPLLVSTNRAEFIQTINYPATLKLSTFDLETVIHPSADPKTSLEGCELKLELYEVGTQGSVGNFCGCVIIAGEELVDLLESQEDDTVPPVVVSDGGGGGGGSPSKQGSISTSQRTESPPRQGSSTKFDLGSTKDVARERTGPLPFVKTKREYDLIADPDTPKTTRVISGKLRVRGGYAHARLAYERTIMIRGCRNVPYIPSSKDEVEQMVPTSRMSVMVKKRADLEGTAPLKLVEDQQTAPNAQLIVKYNKRAIATSEIVCSSTNPMFNSFYVNVPYKSSWIPESDQILMGLAESEEDRRKAKEEASKRTFAALASTVSSKLASAFSGKGIMTETDTLEIEIWDTVPGGGALLKPLNVFTIKGAELTDFLDQEDYQEQSFELPAPQPSKLMALQAAAAATAAESNLAKRGAAASNPSSKGAAAQSNNNNVQNRATALGGLMGKRFSTAASVGKAMGATLPIEINIASLGQKYNAPPEHEAELHKEAEDFRKKIAARIKAMRELQKQQKQLGQGQG